MLDRLAYDDAVGKVFLVPFTGKFPKVPMELEVKIPNAETILRKYPPAEVYTYSAHGDVYVFWRIKKTAKSLPSIETLNKALDLVEDFGNSYRYCFILDTGESEINNYLKLTFARNPQTLFEF